MGDEIVVYPSRGHLLRIGEEFYKLDKEEKDGDNRTVIKQTFIKVSPDDYAHMLKALAKQIAKETPLRVDTIIEDALKDLPLERVFEIQSQINELLPRIISTGGCTELKIGNAYLVLRE